MKKRVFIFSLSLYVLCVAQGYALIINEVLSNPTGDDSGREWVELYNNSSSTIDLSGFTISIKGGTSVPIISVSGGATVSPFGYAIIGSTVSGATKFLQDYPLYNGPLFRSSISLVNTGTTSIDVKSGGVTVASLPSYSAAKEGSSLSLLGGVYIVTTPTPGAENKESGNGGTQEATTTQTSGTQITIPQMSSPSPDIVIYLSQERTVVAGAPTTFSVSATTGAGAVLDNLTCTWSFGDGGSGTGTTTVYRYFYPGRYVAFVDISNGKVAGKGRVLVKVVAPELSISTIKESKYGKYFEVYNPNQYEVDVSTWRVSLDGALFSFPMNTVLLPGSTIISGRSLGFASSTVRNGSVLSLLFPNNEEVVRVKHDSFENENKIEELQATTSQKVVGGEPPKDMIKKSDVYNKNESVSILKNKREERMFSNGIVAGTSTKGTLKETKKTTLYSSLRNSKTPGNEDGKGEVSNSVQNQFQDEQSSKQRTKDTRLATWLKKLFSFNE